MSFTLFLFKVGPEYAAGISLGMISFLASASVPVLWHVSIGMYVNTSEMGVWVSRFRGSYSMPNS